MVKTIKVGSILRHNWKEKVVPYIRMSGVWLHKAGFEPGDRILVLVNEHLIIIKKENGE